MANCNIQQPSRQYSSKIIVDQPQSGGAPPGYVAGHVRVAMPICPPGLEPLMQTNQLQVKEILEICDYFQMARKLVIKNSMGQQIFAIDDNLWCCTSEYWKTWKGERQVAIKDNSGHEVIHLKLQQVNTKLLVVEVSAPPGTVIGSVEKSWSGSCLCATLIIDVKDTSGETILKIKPRSSCHTNMYCCCFSYESDVVFDVFARDGETRVGDISDLRGIGFLCFPLYDDKIDINFPMDLDVKMKAVMIAACSLLSFGDRN